MRAAFATLVSRPGRLPPPLPVAAPSDSCVTPCSFSAAPRARVCSGCFRISVACPLMVTVVRLSHSTPHARPLLLAAGRAIQWPRGRRTVSTNPGTVPESGSAGLHLHRWTDRAVVGVAIAAFASGFAQFGVVAALGDVARGFGQVTQGATFADQAGLSGSELGIGLAVIRLASVGGLPITGLADRFGRRKMLLITVGAGLALTALAAASPR